MAPRKTKVKPDKIIRETPLELPECKGEQGEVWYPPDEFLIAVHDIMIKRYGGWLGFELGLEPYHHLIEEARKAEGIYFKAAILLKMIATTRIFQDGHHRTAYITTKTFLEKNDATFKEKDERKIIKFIKDIRKYDIEQVKDWLENG